MNLFNCGIIDRREKLLNILSKNSRSYLPKLTTSIMKMYEILKYVEYQCNVKLL